MIEAYDVGSMPFFGDFKKFLDGAAQFVFHSPDPYEDESSNPAMYFERKIVGVFIEKLRAGMDIPNYPQFRDMTRMFLEMMDGVEKIKDGYIETKLLSPKTGKLDIPEVLALKRNSKNIYEIFHSTFRVKICITGPYTLSSLFAYKDPELYSRIGDFLAEIVKENIFNNKYGKVELLALDEPTFGLIDDPMMDAGSIGRENLLHAWEKIFHKAQEKGVRTCLHLHSTTDELFWEVDSLKIIESHVNDSLYSGNKTKELLELRDKFLKASISYSNFDVLIRKKMLYNSAGKTGDVTQVIGNVWRKIRSNEINPTVFLENVELMKMRLLKIIDRFGLERIPYAGPECGLRGFPTSSSAIECLKRVSETVKIANATYISGK